MNQIVLVIDVVALITIFVMSIYLLLRKRYRSLGYGVFYMCVGFVLGFLSGLYFDSCPSVGCGLFGEFVLITLIADGVALAFPGFLLGIWRGSQDH